MSAVGGVGVAMLKMKWRDILILIVYVYYKLITFKIFVVYLTFFDKQF